MHPNFFYGLHHLFKQVCILRQHGDVMLIATLHDLALGSWSDPNSPNL